MQPLHSTPWCCGVDERTKMLPFAALAPTRSHSPLTHARGWIFPMCQIKKSYYMRANWWLEGKLSLRGEKQRQCFVVINHGRKKRHTERNEEGKVSALERKGRQAWTDADGRNRRIQMRSGRRPNLAKCKVYYGHICNLTSVSRYSDRCSMVIFGV